MQPEFHQFHLPVQIYTRHAFAKLIGTVPQALAFLTICQQRHHNPEFYIALGACRAAVERKAPARWAREAFRQFADEGHMLIAANDREEIDLDALLGGDESPHSSLNAGRSVSGRADDGHAAPQITRRPTSGIR